MKFTDLNDFRRPPKQVIGKGWIAAFVVLAIGGIAVLFTLNDILEWIVTSTFTWRQNWADTGWFWAFSLIWQIGIFVLVLILVIIIVLYTTLAERKVIAYFQLRQGPNRAGPWGILQPFADMFKILIKEDITPLAADKWVYLLAPILIFLPTLLVFSVIPFTKGFIEMDHRVIPLDSKENREYFEDKLLGYNILDITFATNPNKSVKKKPDLENNIQLLIGDEFVGQSLGKIGPTSVFATQDRKDKFDQNPKLGWRALGPRKDAGSILITAGGSSQAMRTPDREHELWIKAVQIGTPDSEDTTGERRYRLHLVTPDDHKFTIEPGEGDSLLLSQDGNNVRLDLDGTGHEFTVGVEKIFVRWQTNQTYAFYLIPRDLNIGILFIVAVTSLAVIIIFMAGWGSNNKWSLLGAMRSAAQMISYEVPMGLSLLGVVMMAGTTSMVGLVEAQKDLWFVVPQFLGFLIFFTCSIAEINRCPFDMPEAESELVAGYHTEYSGLKFGLFYLAEYANTFIVAALATIIFFGGWYGPGILDDWSVALFGRFTSGLLWFFGKSFFFIGVLIWIRATYPRLRIDHVMEFAWKALIPLAILNLLFTGLFSFSDWNLKVWLFNQWMIRDRYIFSLFRHPNNVFTWPLLIALVLLIFTDIRGRYHELKTKYKFVWSVPVTEDVPALRREALKPENEYKYIHKGFKFGYWVKGSEEEKDIPGYEDE